jgi:hypothetical protein
LSRSVTVMGPSQQEFRDAVWTAMNRCVGALSPTITLAEVLDELRRLGWDADDVRRVEKLTLECLGSVVEGRIYHKVEHRTGNGG